MQGTQDRSQGHPRSTPGQDEERCAGGSTGVLRSCKGRAALPQDCQHPTAFCLSSLKLQVHFQLTAPATPQAQQPVQCREPGERMSLLRVLQPSGLEPSCWDGNMLTLHWFESRQDLPSQRALFKRQSHPISPSPLKNHFLSVQLLQMFPFMPAGLSL